MSKQIKITYPLFVRLLEWAHEDAPDDIAIHKLLERLDLSDDQFNMDSYLELVDGLTK